ncbi:putative metalloprotease [Paenibacillus endophyticus]|uniref:Putative metalloprotease n=1 Tax=Paenibacillus endophyticus TaxID=1294268 RepID=A0A7W5C9Y4_9BACL|nr:hypothetical protein [Paenibacillus endophyticus]MBB3152854.1 putative metalloprotease [Paenibacillus endophyticus]
MRFKELDIPYIEKVNQELLNHSRTLPSARVSKIICGGNPNYISIGGTFIREESLFGVSPKLSVEKIKQDLIYNAISPLLNEQSFAEYIIQNKEYWSWGENIRLKEQVPETALLSKCVLAITHEFSVTLQCDDLQDVEGLLDCLDEQTIYYRYTETTGKKLISLHGRLGTSQCRYLSLKYFLYENGEERSVVVKNQVDTLLSGMCWEDLYGKLKCSHSLYSGVLTDLKKVNLLGSYNANKRLTRINVETDRTTYATVLGMGHPKLTYDEGNLYSKYSLNHHPLLMDYYAELTQLNEQERAVQKKLFDSLYGIRDEQLIENLINIYLTDSYFPHIISIAGNTLTIDEYLIYTKRGKNVEHEGKYSCSLTGYSEIYDDNVEFYRYSVNDDKPAIQSRGEYDFGGEFSREARAELGISTSAGDWRYLGLMISGKANTHRNEVNNQPGTVDFEVLGQVIINQSLENVIKLQEKSIEKDENEAIYGIKVNMFKNKKERTRHLLSRFVEIVIQNKDLVILITLLYPFGLSIYNFIRLLSENTLNISGYVDKIAVKSVLEFIINIFLIIIFCLNFKKILNQKGHRKTLNVYEDRIENELLGLAVSIKRLSEKGISSYLFLGMIYMYIYTLTSDNKENSNT